ncbi:hypothetical protein BpHYR1_047641 [Brachionus plicatilis]|uniref:C-type lectin domain-containing protein n=1 Tax=Brachionus plicatilis TaxID=10195 RepID=A0A3M7RYA1_BRAPC|nr:hypothetical protein BpHYR1_047641 [Brachionus plicatilis]
MPSTPRELTCSAAAEDTCQCENYRNIDSPYYWSPSEKNCRTCPNGYLSGYGYNIQNSLNSITSRCYRVEYSSTLSYSAALASCTANAAHLINIRNSMEMGVAAYWSSGTRSFWVGATALSTANTFTWRNWLSTTVDADLWCRGEPTGGGVGWGAYIHGDRGDCLDQAAVTTNLYFICEYSV